MQDESVRIVSQREAIPPLSNLDFENMDATKPNRETIQREHLSTHAIGSNTPQRNDVYPNYYRSKDRQLVDGTEKPHSERTDKNFDLPTLQTAKNQNSFLA